MEQTLEQVRKEFCLASDWVMLEIRVLLNNLFKADHRNSSEQVANLFATRCHYFQFPSSDLDVEVTFRCDLPTGDFSITSVCEEHAMRIEGKTVDLNKLLQDPSTNRASKGIIDFLLPLLSQKLTIDNFELPPQKQHRFLRMKTVRKLADMELLEISDGKDTIKMMVYANRADELIQGQYLAIDSEGDFQVVPAFRVN